MFALVRDVFLSSLYLAGIRFGDAVQLRFADVREDAGGTLRAFFRLGKSADDIGLLVPRPAEAICRRYREARANLPSTLTGGRIFALLDNETRPDGTWESPRARSIALGTANALEYNRL